MELKISYRDKIQFKNKNRTIEPYLHNKIIYHRYHNSETERTLMNIRPYGKQLIVNKIEVHNISYRYYKYLFVVILYNIIIISLFLIKYKHPVYINTIFKIHSYIQILCLSIQYILQFYFPEKEYLFLFRYFLPLYIIIWFFFWLWWNKYIRPCLLKYTKRSG